MAWGTHREQSAPGAYPPGAGATPVAYLWYRPAQRDGPGGHGGPLSVTASGSVVALYGCECARAGGGKWSAREDPRG